MENKEIMNKWKDFNDKIDATMIDAVMKGSCEDPNKVWEISPLLKETYDLFRKRKDLDIEINNNLKKLMDPCEQDDIEK